MEALWAWVACLLMAAGLLAACSTLASGQSVVDILPAPPGAWGLSYHDGFLWLGDDRDGFIYQIDPDACTGCTMCSSLKTTLTRGPAWEAVLPATSSSSSTAISPTGRQSRIS